MKIKVWNLLDGHRHIAALVGAGGKTTVMYQLAEYLSHMGKKVLVSTTTHILQPSPAVYADSKEHLLALWQQGSYGVCGIPAAEGKLTMLPLNELHERVQLADIVLLEADGAKGRPCKAPAAHEPVILPECDMVIGVVGLDAVGGRADDVCLRADKVRQLLQRSERHRLTPEDIALLLTAPYGTRKDVGDRNYHLVLNKCDTAERMLLAREISGYLQQRGINEDDIWIRGAWQYE